MNFSKWQKKKIFKYSALPHHGKRNNMITDINKILERQDYSRMTESLREKCNKVAEIISKKMKDLELDGTDEGLFVNGIKLFCVDDWLYIHTPEEEKDNNNYRDYCSEYRPVSTVRIYKEFDVDGVGHFDMFSCSNKRALNFLNNAVAIIEKLGEIEKEKVDAISKALEATEKL